MIKIKKFLLSINILFIIILGVIISQISSIIYRYNRLHVFSTDVDELLLDLPNKIWVLWVFWGILLMSLVLQLILELKNRDRN
jgi:hypothetical protein